MGSLRGGHTSGPYGKLLLLAKQEAGLLTSDWERQRAREFREQADGCVAVVERLLQVHCLPRPQAPAPSTAPAPAPAPTRTPFQPLPQPLPQPQP